MNKVLSYLGAGLEDGVSRSIKILGFGLLSAMLAAAANYLTDFRITNELGGPGMLAFIYFINAFLGGLEKWAFTAQQNSMTVPVKGNVTIPDTSTEGLTQV